jgi:hypothetical protein
VALTPFTVQEIAEELLGCVCLALDEVAAANPDLAGCPTCRTCVVPGQAAWDSCGECCGGNGEVGGQLTVGVARMYSSTYETFPAEDRTVRDARGCRFPVTAVELVVTLLRCAPGPDDQGNPPLCEELAESARQLHADGFVVHNSIMCCIPRTSKARNGRRFVMGQQRVLGPEGWCVGVEQRVIVELPGCDPCDLVGVGSAG